MSDIISLIIATRNRRALRRARLIRWSIFTVVTAWLALVAGLALASPPEPGTEQYELLHPHAGWIERVQREHDGYRCCDIADGRVVDARQIGDHWQVRFPRDSGVDAPPGWIDVPEEALVRGDNPVGLPIAWWYAHAVRCFLPGSGA